MNNKKIARELLKIADEISAISKISEKKVKPKYVSLKGTVDAVDLLRELEYLMKEIRMYRASDIQGFGKEWVLL